MKWECHIDAPGWQIKVATPLNIHFNDDSDIVYVSTINAHAIQRNLIEEAAQNGEAALNLYKNGDPFLSGKLLEVSSADYKEHVVMNFKVRLFEPQGPA